MPGPSALEPGDWPGLSERQRQALPAVLSATTVAAGLESAEVPSSTWYRWRRDPEFESALRMLQRTAFAEALDDLKGGTRFAVRGLLGLMASKDERIRLQACRAVVDFGIKSTELGEMSERLEHFEAMLAPTRRIATVGSGMDHALGAMMVLRGKPESRIRRALRVTAGLQAAVGGPFHVLHEDGL